MSKSPRPKPGLVDGTAKSEGSKAAASALHTNTRLVKFDDFQTSFFPTRPTASGRKAASGPSDGSSR